MFFADTELKRLKNKTEVKAEWRAVNSQKKNNEVNMKGKHAEDNEVILSVTNKFASLETELED